MINAASKPAEHIQFVVCFHQTTDTPSLSTYHVVSVLVDAVLQLGTLAQSPGQSYVYNRCAIGLISPGGHRGFACVLYKQ